MEMAPIKNRAKTGLRPCASPRRLQNPVVIALKMLISVTTATILRLDIKRGNHRSTYMLESWQPELGQLAPDSRLRRMRMNEGRVRVSQHLP